MSNQVAVIDFDQKLKQDMLSADVQTVWDAYKRLNGLQSISKEKEQDILKILVANNLNPLRIA